eukprot:6201817-Pleurochrysis_carterae.AAC.3
MAVVFRIPPPDEPGRRPLFSSSTALPFLSTARAAFQRPAALSRYQLGERGAADSLSSPAHAGRQYSIPAYRACSVGAKWDDIIH